MDDKPREWAQAIINGRNPERDEDSDMELALMLEDEIERRGLQYKYMDWLMAYSSLCSDERDQRWAIMRATPEQRARAFLQAVQA